MTPDTEAATSPEISGGLTAARSPPTDDDSNPDPSMIESKDADIEGSSDTAQGTISPNKDEKLRVIRQWLTDRSKGETVMASRWQKCIDYCYGTAPEIVSSISEPKALDYPWMSEKRDQCHELSARLSDLASAEHLNAGLVRQLLTEWTATCEDFTAEKFDSVVDSMGAWAKVNFAMDSVLEDNSSTVSVGQATRSTTARQRGIGESCREGGGVRRGRRRERAPLIAI